MPMATDPLERVSARRQAINNAIFFLTKSEIRISWAVALAHHSINHLHIGVDGRRYHHRLIYPPQGPIQ